MENPFQGIFQDAKRKLRFPLRFIFKRSGARKSRGILAPHAHLEFFEVPSSEGGSARTGQRQRRRKKSAADPQQLAQMQEKLGKVRDHVDNAVGQQAEANRKLPLRQLAQAQPNQESSEAELKMALEALQDEDQQQQQQQGQNNEEGDKEEPEQQESSEDQLGQQQDGQQEEEQQEQEMQAAKAEDILNEEKDQREERRRKMPVRFRAVDKNW